MARLIYGFVLFTVVFAQATIVPAINPLAITPDLVLLLLVLVSMFRGPGEGLAWLFVAGIVIDVLAMDPLGANGIALLPAVLLVAPEHGRVARSNILIPVGLVIVATILHGCILALIRGIMPDTALLLQALLHAAIFPLLYFALRWLE